MDEINEKAIKDIIAYYDRMDKEKSEEPPEPSEPAQSPEPEPFTQNEEAQSLVELIEDAHRQKEAETERTAQYNAEGNAISQTNTVETEENEEIKPKPSETAEADDEAEPVGSEEEAKSVGSEEAEPVGGEEAEPVGSEEETKEEKKDIPLSITPVYDLSELEDEENGAEEFEVGKKHIITAAVITAVIAALIVVFIAVDSGPIGIYKQNASRNITSLLAKFGIDLSRDETDGSGLKTAGKYKSSSQMSVTVPMETAGKSVFAAFRGSLVCAYTNYLSLIAGDGKTVWENTTTIVDPILRTAGNYILIAENGGKKLCLYNDSRLVYEADTEDNILTCNLSSNGDAVVVTEKPAYKGAVVVFNREGNQIFAWSSGSDDILSADISSASRRVAVALLNTDDKVKSTIQLFDMNETESKVQAIFEDTILFDIAFAGDTVNAFGDNCMAGLTAQGDLIYDKRFDSAEFVHYGIDETGNKILLFDDTNIPLINIYAQNGSLKYQLTSDELPEYVGIFGKYIVYNSGRDVIYGKSGKRQLSKYVASMDIKNLLMIGEDTFAIVYSNNIEIVGK